MNKENLIVLARELFIDAVGLSGLGSIVYGVYQMHEPCAYLVGGAGLICWAIKASKTK